MSWLKRVLGTTDAMAEARAESAQEDAATSAVPSAQAARPAGWGEVETSQHGDDLVIALPAPGLDEDSTEVEPEGSSLKLHAKGSNSQGHQILLNETLALPEGSDATQASVSFTGGRLVVRIPKSALKTRAG